MDILVVGGGGREHAIVRALRRNPEVATIWVLPGNGGIALDATCVPIAATDLDKIVAFVAAHPVDLAIVTPDDPLCLGLVDRLNAVGVKAFGPTAAAARIEGSKAYAKDLMRRGGIPTADYQVFADPEAALGAVAAAPLPVVVKADGLALGKGVTVAATRDEAERAVREAMLDRRFGDSGARVVVERCLTGIEASLLLLADGETYRLLPSAMDHKRALDGDLGPNTGGMGAVAPHPSMTPGMTARVEREIVQPVLTAMVDEGCPFRGCLYVGLMLTDDGPKVIEFNARFGDPETQAVLALLRSDLAEALLAVVEGRLADVELRFTEGAACCVVLASGGYPGAYRTGVPITGWRQARARGAALDFAGVTRTDDGGLVTSGGRVLSVTATAATLTEAVEKAYVDVGRIAFEAAYHRRDIGRRALDLTAG
jgi:phosphoribosylamine--glycine ligase